MPPLSHDRNNVGTRRDDLTVEEGEAFLDAIRSSMSVGPDFFGSEALYSQRDLWMRATIRVISQGASRRSTAIALSTWSSVASDHRSTELTVRPTTSTSSRDPPLRTQNDSPVLFAS